MLYAAAALAIAVTTGLIGWLAIMPNLEWYDTLAAPSFGPPGWSYPMVFGHFDLAIDWAFYRVLCRPDWMPDRPAAIRTFLIQTGLAVVWPLALFVARSPAAGLAALLALLAATVVTGRAFGAVDRAAGRCVLLYGFWVGFTAVVVLSITIRN